MKLWRYEGCSSGTRVTWLGRAVDRVQPHLQPLFPCGLADQALIRQCDLVMFGIDAHIILGRPRRAGQDIAEFQREDTGFGQGDFDGGGDTVGAAPPVELAQRALFGLQVALQLGTLLV